MFERGVRARSARTFQHVTQISLYHSRVREYFYHISQILRVSLIECHCYHRLNVAAIIECYENSYTTNTGTRTREISPEKLERPEITCKTCGKYKYETKYYRSIRELEERKL